MSKNCLLYQYSTLPHELVQLTQEYIMISTDQVRDRFNMVMTELKTMLFFADRHKRELYLTLGKKDKAVVIFHKYGKHYCN